jgi:hypothetical protein
VPYQVAGYMGGTHLPPACRTQPVHAAVQGSATHGCMCAGLGHAAGRSTARVYAQQNSSPNSYAPQSNPPPLQIPVRSLLLSTNRRRCCCRLTSSRRLPAAPRMWPGPAPPHLTAAAQRCRRPAGGEDWGRGRRQRGAWKHGCSGRAGCNLCMGLEALLSQSPFRHPMGTNKKQTYRKAQGYGRTPPPGANYPPPPSSLHCPPLLLTRGAHSCPNPGMRPLPL